MVASTLVQGCMKPNADADAAQVQVTAHVKDPVIAVQPSSLVNSITGSFDLTVSVGHSATEDAVFSDPPSFELVTQDGASITPLDAVLDEDPFPLTLSPGKGSTLSFTLSKRNTVSSEQLATLCSGPVVIVGVLLESSSNRQTVAESSPTAPGGCF
jgi:hypothetical protein